MTIRRPSPAPLADFELRAAARTWRAPLLALGTVAILGVVTWLVYQGRAGTTSLTTPPPVTEGAEVGRAVFQWSVFAVVVLLLFLAPALGAGVVAGERERRTLLPLQVTGLAASRLLAGKVAGLAGQLLLAVAAAAPVLALVTLLGGVTFGQVVAAVVVLALESVVLAAAVAACSALAGRLTSATVLAFGAVALAVGGTLATTGAVAVLDGARGDDPVDPPTALLAPNPLLVVADAAGDRPGGVAVDTPLSGLRTLSRRGGDPPLPWWLAGLAVQGAAAGLLLVAATLHLRLPERR